jgi:hypothetical protein
VKEYQWDTKCPSSILKSTSLPVDNTDSSYVIHHLRTRYLKNYPDGVGERIISINSNSISGAAARAGGYLKPEDLKRTYSPPITAEPAYLGANPRATTTIRGENGWKGRIKRSDTMPNMSHHDAEISDDDASEDEYTVDPDLLYPLLLKVL